MEISTEMCLFLLVRHGAHALGGHVVAGRSDQAMLSPAGHEQARLLGQRLQHLPIRAIYSSPVRRTRETARHLADAFGLDFQVSEALNEIDFGDWVGRPFDEIRPAEEWHRWNAFRSGSGAPGGEMMLQAQQRVVAEMLRLRDRHRGQYVVLVSHGDVIRAAVAYFLGVPLDLFLRIEISLGSVSAVCLADRGPWVLGVNNTSEIIRLPE